MVVVPVHVTVAAHIHCEPAHGLIIRTGALHATPAFVFDNGVKYRWGDPFGDPTDHYMEVHRGDTITLEIWTNDLDGQAWANAANGAWTCVYGDGYVIDYTAITEDKSGTYYSAYWPYTGGNASGFNYWYKHYDGWGSGATRWVAEDRMIIKLNMTILPTAPLGLTTIGLQQRFYWAPSYFWEQRIDADNNPAYQMELFVRLSPVPGDFDDDGDVDVDDIDALCANMTGDGVLLPPGSEQYDLDGDGDADSADMDILIHDLVETTVGIGTEYGDFNLDGTVDTVDLTILGTYFGTGTTWSQGNANCDTTVDTVDLTILATYFGFVAASPIPEPATLALMGCGAVALMHKRRRA